MAESSSVSSLILKIIDEVSKPAKEVKKSLDQVRDSAHRMRRETPDVSRDQNAFNRALRETATFGREAARTLGEVVAGYVGIREVLAEPIKAASELERSVEDLSLAAKKLSGEQLARLREDIKRLAHELPTTEDELTKAATAALGLGLSTDKMADALAYATKVGYATGRSTEDIVRTLKALQAEFDLTEDGARRAFDQIVTLAQRGGEPVDKFVDVIRDLGSEGGDIGFTAGQIGVLVDKLKQGGVEGDKAAKTLRGLFDFLAENPL